VARTILTPDNTHIELEVPVEYVGRKVEITFSPIDEYNTGKKSTMADFFGILSDETSKELHTLVRRSRDE
jgi:hypothetical protein